MAMRRLCCLHAPLLALWMLASPLPQGTTSLEDPHSKNFHPKGHDIDPALFFQNIHSDLAFWGRLAFQGTYDGFRIVDITEHGNPNLVIKFRCNGAQEDVSVWQHLLFRSIDQPQTTDTRDSGNMPLPGANHCHDIAVHLGVHRAVGACNPFYNMVWDISDPAYPVALYKFSHPLVPSWHSASFTWDGRVMVMGWEPGGGVQPHCQDTSPDVEKTIFFFDTATGVL